MSLTVDSERIHLLSKLLTIKARTSFRHFVAKTMPEYKWNWHHKLLCDRLQDLMEGKVMRLMVFMPPRHGKSELCSRRFPAFCFGVNPDLKVIATSYSADLASDMNTDCQKVMDNADYHEVFPDTNLSGRNVVTTTQPKRNSTRFDIVGKKGYYVSAGVGGAITGKGADIAIIDDPIKNADEAESTTFREKVWKWYGSTLYTRLEEGGRVLLVMTRWHEDDLAGRLLKQMREDPKADQWVIVNLPAIKEVEDNVGDPRKEGEALWPGKYDIEQLNKIFATIGSRYAISLYQQKPSPLEGSIIKRDWFEYYQKGSVNMRQVDFYIDSSYTEKTTNDPTAIIAYYSDGRRLYLIHCIAKHMDFPHLIKFLPEYLESHGYTSRSRVYIEPKASGKSIAQELKDKTRINIIEDNTKKDLSKLTCVFAASPTMEAGRVLLPEGESWTEDFLLECAQFPNGTHDDKVDCLTGAIRRGIGVSPISMHGMSR